MTSLITTVGQESPTKIGPVRPNRSLMLFRLATASAALVVLGSVDHGTTRTWEPDALGSGSVMTEGASRWGAWTLLLGLLALATVRWWAGAPHPRTWLGAVVVPACWTAAFLAGRHWLRLLEEQERPRAYALEIAVGLPVVTVAGAVGGMVTLLLVVDRWRTGGIEEAG